MIERWVIDFINPYDRIERATVADVTELSAFDVVWNRLPLLGDCGNIVGRNVNEFRKWIDEPPDEPGTGDAVDLRMLSRDPLIVQCPHLFARRQTHLFPTCKAALEVRGLDSGATQACSNTLAEFASMHAVGHNRFARRQVLEPTLESLRRAMEGAHNQFIVVAVNILAPDIDHHRSRRGAETSVEFAGRNGMRVFVHAQSPWRIAWSPIASSSRFLLPLLSEHLVEIVEHLRASRDPLQVIRRGQRDAIDQRANADSFVAAEFAVPEIDVMNDFCDRTKRRIVQCNTIEQHFEGAFVADMRELRLEHIEAQLAFVRPIGLT